MYTAMGECARQMYEGAFLMTGSMCNPMTIGWCQWGVIWGKNICTVLVRKSRFSHDTMESGRFTVSVPRPGTLKRELAYCGTKSGRDGDKLKALGLSPVALGSGAVGGFPGCAYHFDCRTLFKSDMDLSMLDPAVRSRYYGDNQATPDGDPHTVYFAEIENVYEELI